MLKESDEAEGGGGRGSSRRPGGRREVATVAWRDAETRDVGWNDDNEADRPGTELVPIRMKLAGPWQRPGCTVGHEERGVGGGGKGGEYPGD